ncbi:hypothetical protein Kpho02_67630 [Kitasatospora phosalacinea]|uniref:Uncharacterized protein n=1 Tax=Kitasatospora phosalacinea TaxID=2065 RepID=A0A9W6V6S3_9ACTN|nr:hypothetical protein Kpho02_67630 [Kitasatospora phosalacinea]
MLRDSRTSSSRINLLKVAQGARPRDGADRKGLEMPEVRGGLKVQEKRGRRKAPLDLAVWPIRTGGELW